MIEVKGLSKSYGSYQAIKGLNFEVQKGEVVGFLGPNGAGKTTTMKIITGYMSPNEGSVKVAGFDVFESPLKVKENLGYLPEIPPLYMDMTVRSYLIFVARIKKVPPEKVKDEVEDCIQKTQLKSVAHRMIGHLSKGYRQRVGLAQALLFSPPILILDEPTSGLDPRQIIEVRELINELKKDHTILISTHILSEVEAICDRAIIITQGRIVAQDSLSNLSKKAPSKKLFLRVQKGTDDLEKALQKVKGVGKIKKGPKEWEISFQGEGNLDEVAKAVLSSGAGLLEIRKSSLDLENVFIQLTKED